MPHVTKLLGLHVFALAVFAAAPAFAIKVLACEVKETPDGFVAIRATPSASGQLIAQARPNQILEVLVEKNRTPIASGKWWRVRHYPGEAMPFPVEVVFKDVRVGWLHSRFVDGCDR